MLDVIAPPKVDYAELLNGKLRLLSEPTRGTQVILSIPYPVS